MVTFTNLGEAIKDGWTVMEARPDGYTLRKKVNDVWALALCEPKKDANEYR
jgi:hypothetical protein